MTTVVAKEVAEKEFERFIEAMDLDVDPSGMDETDRQAFTNARARFVRAVSDGSLVVNDNGEPVYTPKVGERAPITFREPKGSSWMAMDAKKRDHSVTKMYAAMADCTGENVQRFSQMANRDTKVCESIIALFLA